MVVPTYTTVRKIETQELSGKSWEVWEEELAGLAKRTRYRYIETFKKVIAEWGVTPDELYSMRFNDMKSEDPRDFKNMERKLKKHMKEMEDQGSAKQSCLMIRKAFSSFFSAQSLDLKFKKTNGNGANGSQLGQKMITVEQFKILYNGLNQLNKKRNQAILMTGKDTGLRVSDLAELTIGNYLDAEEKTSDFGETFKVIDPTKTEKCGVYAWIHLGPESIETLDEYLLEREGKGDPLNKDSPLFLNRQKAKYTPENLSSVIQKQCKKHGLKRISMHSLRKRHKTKLEKFMPEQWVLMLEGKSSSEYSRPQDEGELTTVYMKAYEAIRIFGIPDNLKRKIEEETNEEMTRLRTENTELGSLLLRLQESVDALTRRQDALEK